MLFIAISSALGAIICGVMSWARGSEMFLIAAVANSFIAAGSTVALWVSDRPVRTEWWGAIRTSLWALAIVALVPAVLTGLIWFFMWVVVPSVLIVPLIFGWELIQLEVDVAPILSPQHA